MTPPDENNKEQLHSLQKISGIEVCKEDIPMFVDHEVLTGVVKTSTHQFIEKEVFTAELQVLICQKCGKESIGWRKIDLPPQ